MGNKGGVSVRLQFYDSNICFICKMFSFNRIDHFKELFPNKLPRKLGVTPDAIAYLQGQQSVIERMEFILDDDKPDEI